MDRDAHRFHRRPQHGAAGAVELLFHQVAAEMDDVDVAAVVEQAARRFQAEQAAADHGGLRALLRVGDDAVAVVERAEGEDAGAQLAVGVPSCPRSAG